ncbi:MAG: branched-chain amino acid ABC transporter permease [Sphaerochaetaceae bacterium]|jgi:branched-chain amino acid transport system permease protein|nr:branched-chain amino acid ABC transporter permease [Sphaerochaetaceae bacterium]NLO60852.1 branched-chain amino acid ABC transporter permease [Spirochaetales bacterium]MDD2405560.1 branched-chain amino acid ABC transporter permease [Sphaerochaetaceae bacterium]MDD3671206.1 branched-chain amino acid ABC transporter permease [Sphaerochaetaceae bacterium]MDD4259892.1 branched-chain amino acid ABC transporter permease [Sphaerochaetaceae bacterium]
MGSAAEFFQHLMNGLTLGGIYALIALGYTMVYGILKFINFAHGDILMVGSYIGLFVYNAIRGQILGFWTIIAFFLSMLVGMVFSAVLGIAIERIAYKPLRKATRLAPLLSAIGVSFILSNLAAWMWGTKSKKLEYPFNNAPLHIGGVAITPHQILILVVVIVMMVALKLFIDRSRMGKAMRATSLDQDTAKLMGVKVDRIIALTFAIGSALAATAGFLIALEIKVYPSMGTMTGLKAFVAAVVGGIGNISGAMVGGILLGLIETFGVALIGIPYGLRDTIAFAVLIIILLVKPEGLLGKAEKEKV